MVSACNTGNSTFLVAAVEILLLRFHDVDGMVLGWEIHGERRVLLRLTEGEGETRG